jgi:hypothetical protein
MLLARSLHLSRCASIGATLLLAMSACGADSPDPGAADAQRAGASDASADSAMPGGANGCAAVPDDQTPTAQAGPFDGVYTYADANTINTKPICTGGSSGTSNSYYLKLDHGRRTAYLRVYPSGTACLNAQFDVGGQLQIIVDGALRGCGPMYATSAGSYQQGVGLATLGDGSLFREYLFFGEGPENPKWDEVIVSTISGDHPFDQVPADLNFGHYRRAK